MTETTEIRKPLELRGFICVALLLAFGVVAWQHLLHATVLLRSDAGIGTHVPHMLRDGLLAVPLALVAVVVGLNFAQLIAGRRAAPLWLRAAVVTEIYMLSMLAAVPVHAKIDVALGGAHVEEGAWLLHAVRDALTGQFVAFPLMIVGLYAASDPARAFTRVNVARTAAVLTVVGGLAAAGSGGALIFVIAAIFTMLIASDRARSLRLGLALALVGTTLVVPGPLGLDDGSIVGAVVDENGCQIGTSVKSYDVAAIDIEMTLNQFGDNDPNAMMYVLENRIAAVRAQEAAGTVSPGLRDDPIQPLVIRANVGECLEINFRNGLNSGTASFHVFGLPFTAVNAGGAVGMNPNSLIDPGDTITYRFAIPDVTTAEGTYNFHSMSDPRQTMAHGLFGTLVIEPKGSVYLHPENSAVEIESGWEAIIVDPRGVDFREFVIMMHEVGDEAFNVIEGVTGEPFEQIDPITGSYRPGSRALNYRSEPFRDRLLLGADKSLAYSSYTFGDPATPIPRSYLGEPTKTRLSHPGSEVFHVYHLHGGGNRWPRDPKASMSDFAVGLDKEPTSNMGSTRLDSQSAGPGETFTLEHECGAGGCQQAAGDFLFHCHIGSHYVSGMWSFWRVFDTTQADLAIMPADPGYIPPPVADAGNSIDLIGQMVDGRVLVPAADITNPATELAVEDYVESLLPPQGVPLDDQDATVWDWELIYDGGDPSRPLFLGEPDDAAVWANYVSPTPGARPEIRFNLNNGRLAWPHFSPHLGQRPPFAPNGHGGTPWLGADSSASRPDGICPSETQVPGRRVLNYPVSAIDVPIPIGPGITDLNGMIYALNEDIADITGGSQTAEPLVLRSNVGDCIDLILTSEQVDANHGGFAKVNMHTHFVQFDPQASDGVITGMSYEQSVRPYSTESRTLDVASTPGATTIEVDNVARLRVGISIGVGLGEGMCDTVDGLQVANPDNADRPCTEVRTIVALTPAGEITLDAPLVNHHAAGQAVGVEFVQYRWYSDADVGTVFFHDHTDFSNWDHGLFAAHIIEPKGSTYHDPMTGDEIRTGTVADIHSPPDASIGAGQSGSFRELMVFLHNGATGTDGADIVEMATLNLRSEPLGLRDGTFPFSSVTNGDPVTPILRAYVGDNVVFRNLGVVERVGALRVTGHRYLNDRFESNSSQNDTSSVGISEREDLVLLDGAGGQSGLPGDYLFYSTKVQDLDSGAWGIMRVHDTSQGDLQALPDGPNPSGGAGFPQQTVTGLPPTSATTAGTPCPAFAPVRSYSVSAFDPPPGSTFGSTMFEMSTDVAAITAGTLEPTPLVIRANHGDCIEIQLSNNSGGRAGLNIAKVVADVQRSGGSAVGFNLDSTVDSGSGRLFRYYADEELGTSLIFNLVGSAELMEGGWGALIVEPSGSAYLDPDTGLQTDGSGVESVIWNPSGGSFREFVTLFQDEDADIGANAMPYPTVVDNFAGINFREDLLRTVGGNAGRMEVSPVDEAFGTSGHGDPANLFEAYVGEDIRFRIGQPSGMQGHVFGLDGHKFPSAHGIVGSELLSHRGIVPGESFDAHLRLGAGGGITTEADYIFGDWRMPFMEAGAWGIMRTFDSPESGLFAVPQPAEGQLRVTTNPALMSQIVVDGEPRDRWGLDWVDIAPGSHEVCFTDLPGWTTPDCQDVVVTSNGVTVVEGVFSQNGTLRVVTDPPVPGTISLNGVPSNDWGLWTDFEPGSYEVCFGDVANFDTPGCETVNLTAGADMLVTGTYIGNGGSSAPSGHGFLRVVTVPGSPSQISVDGIPRDRWGLNWVKIAPGWHEVCFGDVRDRTTAPCETVLVTAGAVTLVSSSFPGRGFLRVETSPPQESTITANGIPLDDWGVWTDLPPADYEVCFSEVNGFAPPCQTVTVTAGGTQFVQGVWP